MAYIDRDILREEFVYDGLFYTKGQNMIPPDGSLFGMWFSAAAVSSVYSAETLVAWTMLSNCAAVRR